MAPPEHQSLHRASHSLITRQWSWGNSVVVSPAYPAGVIQRRARPRPNHCTLPAAESSSSARCTVR